MTKDLLYCSVCFLLGGFLIPAATDTNVKLGFRLGLIITMLAVWIIGLYWAPYQIAVRTLQQWGLWHDLIPIVAVAIVLFLGGCVALIGQWIALAVRASQRDTALERSLEQYQHSQDNEYADIRNDSL